MDYYIQSRSGDLNAIYKDSRYPNALAMHQAIRNVGAYMAEYRENIVWVSAEEILFIQDVTPTPSGDTNGNT